MAGHQVDLRAAPQAFMDQKWSIIISMRRSEMVIVQVAVILV
jgi:hypothetical protein